MDPTDGVTVIFFEHPTGKKSLELVLDDGDTSQFDIKRAFNAGKFYEHETSLTMLRVLRPGDICLDVGANVGFFTALMGTLIGPSGHVFAFEPNPRHQVALVRHIERNGVAATVLPVAVGEKRCMLRFSDGGEQDGNGGFVPDDTPGAHTLVAVETLDQLASEHPLIGSAKLIKLDIEGAEGAALLGAQHLLLSERLEIIVCEANPPLQARLGHAFPELRERLAGNGFDCFLPLSSGDLPTYVPPAVGIVFTHVTNVVFMRKQAAAKYWPSVTAVATRFIHGY